MRQIASYSDVME